MENYNTTNNPTICNAKKINDLYSIKNLFSLFFSFLTNAFKNLIVPTRKQNQRKHFYYEQNKTNKINYI